MFNVKSNICCIDIIRTSCTAWHSKQHVMIESEIIDEISDLVQDCCNSTANALELLQSGTKPLHYCYYK